MGRGQARCMEEKTWGRAKSYGHGRERTPYYIFLRKLASLKHAPKNGGSFPAMPIALSPPPMFFSSIHRACPRPVSRLLWCWPPSPMSKSLVTVKMCHTFPGDWALVLSGFWILLCCSLTTRDLLRFFLGFGCARCSGPGCSGQPGSGTEPIHRGPPHELSALPGGGVCRCLRLGTAGGMV